MKTIRNEDYTTIVQGRTWKAAINKFWKKVSYADMTVMIRSPHGHLYVPGTKKRLLELVENFYPGKETLTIGKEIEWEAN